MIGRPQSCRTIDFRGAFAKYVAEQGQMLPGPCHRINRKTPPISRAHQLHDVKLETANANVDACTAVDLSWILLCSRQTYAAVSVNDIFFSSSMWDPTNGKPLWETRIENSYICNNDNVKITCNSLLSSRYCFWDKRYQQCRWNIWQRIST